METAFVAGASGYTGRAVVAELVAAGVRVHAHVRPDSPRLAAWHERFSSLGAGVDTTPWERGAMTATMRTVRPSVVFALLGTTRRRARSEAMTAAQAYERVDIGLTLLLLDAIEAAEVAPRLVYLSSVGTHPKTRNPYLAARARVEAELARRSIQYTVVRSPMIAGLDRDDGRWLEGAAANVADTGLALLGALGLCKLRERYRSITNVALARALVRIAFDADRGNSSVDSGDLHKIAGI